MIIGIAGPSCSGKSSISEIVAANLGMDLMHLDGRWISGSEKPIVAGFPSYEQPHQYDGASLLAEMQAAQTAGRDIIVEGFLLFAYPEILALCDHRFFIEVDHDELVRRRVARTAAGGNVTWGAIAADSTVDKGWLAHGREEWQQWGAPQASLPGVVVIDGSRPVAESARDVVEMIRGVGPKVK